MRAALCAVAVLSCWLSTPALAEEPIGDDEISLKDGGVLRGIVITEEPRVGVKLKVLGEEEPRFIAWDRVDQVIRGKYAAAPRAQPPAPEAPPDAQRSVRLHVDSPVRVEVRAHSAASFTETAILDTPRTVCFSPCDRLVDTSGGQVFTVAGDNVNESLPFTLSTDTGVARVKVRPGRRSLTFAGLAVTSLGAAAAAAGMALTLSGLAHQNVQGQLMTGSGSSALVPLGGTAIGLGVGALIAGMVLVFQGRTTLELSPQG
jgi:hypothetical protein